MGQTFARGLVPWQPWQQRARQTALNRFEWRESAGKSHLVPLGDSRPVSHLMCELDPHSLTPQQLNKYLYLQNYLLSSVFSPPNVVAACTTKKYDLCANAQAVRVRGRGPSLGSPPPGGWQIVGRGIVSPRSMAA